MQGPDSSFSRLPYQLDTDFDSRSAACLVSRLSGSDKPTRRMWVAAAGLLVRTPTRTAHVPLEAAVEVQQIGWRYPSDGYRCPQFVRQRMSTRSLIRKSG